jgi:anhydro-N-acetylmuramic acid kinase
MSRWIIGLAPGSSLCGIDAVLLEVHGSGMDLGARVAHALHLPHGRDLRNLIQRLGSGAPAEVKSVGLLNRLMGETFALAARQVADQARFSLQQVMCVSCPGLALWHEPDARYPSLLESGMPAIVAERTGLTTVSDFRTADLAAGGLATPVETLADYLLFSDTRENRVLVHLGGTATVVFLSAGCPHAEAAGFEAGPCNLFLDSLVRHLTGSRDSCDPGGKYAVQGRCIEPLLESWLTHAYWQRRPPKILSPAAFGDAFAAQAVQMARQHQWERNDLLCTATHLVARGISSAVRRFAPNSRLPDRLLLSGGGIRNGLLWHLLEQQLDGSVLARTDSVGVPAEYRRALAFGILAALTLDGVPANIPAATGAAGARLLGTFTPGSPQNWARCLAWMASQTAIGYRLAG